MSKPFLGIGWGFPLAVNRQWLVQHGRIRGERAPVDLDHPGHGQRGARDASGFRLRHLRSGVRESTVLHRRQGGPGIREALLLFEPRIDVLDYSGERPPTAARCC